LSPSSNINREIKLREMIWVENIACLGNRRYAYTVLGQNIKEGTYASMAG
jgi:hypothetical protein